MKTWRAFFFFLGWSLVGAMTLWGTPIGTLKTTQALYPRTDLNMVVGGIPLEPGMGLTSWTALVPLPPAKPGRAPDFLALGEMVLLEEEVPSAQAELKRRSFQVEALLGPYLNGSPAVKHLYFSAQGPQGRLAEGLKALGRILALSQPRPGKTPSLVPLRRASPTPSPTPNPLKSPEVLWTQVEAVLGPGERVGKLLNYVIPRGEAALKGGVELPVALGVGTEFHFQRVEGLVMGEKRPLGLAPKATQPVVAVTGQFALQLEEIEPVRAYLTRQGVTVMEAQGHLEVSPRLTFMDFWVVGSPEEIARTLKEALEKTGSLKPTSLQTQTH